MTPTRRFPQEIVDMVIDHLHDENPSLAACSLVSPTWLPSSRHHLFSDLTLPVNLSSRSFDSFRDLLYSHKSPVQIGPHIRHLKCRHIALSPVTTPSTRISVPQLAAILSKLPRLRTLLLDTVRLTHPDLRVHYHLLRPTLPSSGSGPSRPFKLHKLTLTNVRIDQAAEYSGRYLTDLFRLFSHISHLRLRSLSSSFPIYVPLSDAVSVRNHHHDDEHPRVQVDTFAVDMSITTRPFMDVVTHAITCDQLKNVEATCMEVEELPILGQILNDAAPGLERFEFVLRDSVLEDSPTRSTWSELRLASLANLHTLALHITLEGYDTTSSNLVSQNVFYQVLHILELLPSVSSSPSSYTNTHNDTSLPPQQHANTTTLDPSLLLIYPNANTSLQTLVLSITYLGQHLDSQLSLDWHAFRTSLKRFVALRKVEVRNYTAGEDGLGMGRMEGVVEVARSVDIANYASGGGGGGGGDDILGIGLMGTPLPPPPLLPPTLAPPPLPHFPLHPAPHLPPAPTLPPPPFPTLSQLDPVLGAGFGYGLGGGIPSLARYAGASSTNTRGSFGLGGFGGGGPGGLLGGSLGGGGLGYYPSLPSPLPLPSYPTLQPYLPPSFFQTNTRHFPFPQLAPPTSFPFFPSLASVEAADSSHNNNDEDEDDERTEEEREREREEERERLRTLESLQATVRREASLIRKRRNEERARARKERIERELEEWCGGGGGKGLLLVVV